MTINPEIIKLKNGSTLIFDKTETFFSTAVRIQFDFGSHNESTENYGIAHFIEHMMFKGTKKRSAKQIIEELDLLAADINAYTGKETTTYTLNIVNKYLFQGLEILCDMLSNSVFHSDEIEKERNVIIQEIYECADDPEEFLHDNFLDICYKNEPLGHNILGTLETVSKINYENLITYKNQYYTPENAIIAVSGNIDKNELIHFLETNLILNSQSKTVPNPSHFKCGSLSLHRELEQYNFILSFPSISFFDKNYYIANIMCMILGSGMSSRLFMQIREQKALCYSIGSYLTLFNNSGMLSISSSTSKDKLEKSIDEIIKVINSMAHITEYELNKIKTHFRVFFMTSLDSVSTRVNYCLNQYTRNKHIPSFEDISKEIDLITTSDIEKIAKETFKKDSYSFGIIGNNPPENLYDRFKAISLD